MIGERFRPPLSGTLYLTMTVRFPTRPLDPNKGYPSLKGEPLRARTCRCGPKQILDPDGLCACGYWPPETVDETWARQARRELGPVSSLDRMRKRMMERQYGRAA